MPRAIRGVLVECDPSIKSIIVKIDSERNDFIVEELDDQTLVIKEGMLSVLKMRLDEALKETQQPPDDSGSE
ncbi:MAG: TFIIH complex subunit tfb5 [Claussenomyces sp. TS43310]|nr:MAG: TFIIH complex subunit tfb5 [Claussenomyces sp. TS43310]